MQYSEKSSTPPIRLTGIPVPALIHAHAQVLAARKRRQDELLDAALLETFPASDPISVMRIT